MKTTLAILLVLAAGCPSLALADPSFEVAQFGRMNGILNSCSRVNAQQASKYLLQIKALIGDANREAVDEARKSEPYQQAYQAITEELGNLGHDELAQACDRYLAVSG